MSDLKRYDVLAMGDLNVDLILGVNSLPEFGHEILAQSIGQHLGGCTANFACYCARLGLRVALLARVGDDDFGHFLVSELQRLGVDPAHVIVDPELNTGLTVSLSGPQDRAFVTYLGAIDSLTGAEVSDDLLAGTRLVHAGSYFLQTKLQPGLPDVLRRAHQAGALTSLDTGYDPYESWDSGLAEVLTALDLFLPNEVEAAAIAREADPIKAGRKLAQIGPAVALKLGARGARFLSDTTEVEADPYRVEVVDTTCCGDAFNAGFLAAWLDGKPPAEGLAWGNACGALVASGSGNAADRVSAEAVTRLVTENAVRGETCGRL